MNKSSAVDNVLRTFPSLKQAGKEMSHMLYEEGIPLLLEEEQFICMPGNRSCILPLILSGQARVYSTGERGREITLYRLSHGESCILTASCILSHQLFPAYARAETAIEAFGIPDDVFRSWMHHYEVWRSFIFDLLSSRLATIISVVDEVAFRRMDARIAEYLVETANPIDGCIDTTHEAIAADLGSSREVVSRILKEFEHQGVIRLSRGCIKVLHPQKLYKTSERV